MPTSRRSTTSCFEQQLEKALVERRTSPIHGRDPARCAAASPRRGPERLLDLMLRTGPYGDGFGARPDGLTLARARDASRTAIDLGPARAARPRAAAHARRARSSWRPTPLVAEIDRLRAEIGAAAEADHGAKRGRGCGSLVLVGRRDLRSNNSWMHNVPGWSAGTPRCTLQVHPDGRRASRARRRRDGRACARASAASTSPVEVTDAIMPGVVSMPHGCGHDDRRRRGSRSPRRTPASTATSWPTSPLDPLSGNAVLNGIPVTVEPAIG